MYNLKKINYINMTALERPYLIVVIDTEEDFDWSKDFSRENTSVVSMKFVERGQIIFDKYNIRPVYVVDYPVVSQPDGYQVLRDFYTSGCCEIGVHVHPWVTPPFEENDKRENSFAGNLPRDLEKKKIQNTCELINDVFGQRPTIYKAGRYGVGANTAEILAELDFEVDLSVCPCFDFSLEGGPDFTHYTSVPFWFGKEYRILELPLTIGFSGLLRKKGLNLHNFISSSLGRRLHVPGIASRLKLLNRVCLSPEGYTSSELIDLVKVLYRDGLRVFSFALHSPSLNPGNTPYVRSNDELKQFLKGCTEFFNFFMDELNGEATTPLALKERLLQPHKDNILERI